MATQNQKEKIRAAQKAWTEVRNNPNKETIEKLRTTMKAAGLNYTNLKEMEKEFAKDFIHNTPATDKEFKEKLKHHFRWKFYNTEPQKAGSPVTEELREAVA